MLDFKTDEQTLGDLNIFPKHRGDISIIEYFDKTKTNGGREVLNKLMHTPKNNKEDIEDTIMSIQYCGTISNSIIKCLNQDHLDFIQYYMDEERYVHREIEREIERGWRES